MSHPSTLSRCLITPRSRKPAATLATACGALYSPERQTHLGIREFFLDYPQEENLISQLPPPSSFDKDDIELITYVQPIEVHCDGPDSYWPPSRCQGINPRKTIHYSTWDKDQPVFSSFLLHAHCIRFIQRYEHCGPKKEVRPVSQFFAASPTYYIKAVAAKFIKVSEENVRLGQYNIETEALARMLHAGHHLALRLHYRMDWSWVRYFPVESKDQLIARPKFQQKFLQRHGNVPQLKRPASRGRYSAQAKSLALGVVPPSGVEQRLFPMLLAPLCHCKTLVKNVKCRSNIASQRSIRHCSTQNYRASKAFTNIVCIWAFGKN